MNSSRFKSAKEVLSSAMFHPHFVVLSFPSAFGAIRILSSAIFHPHFVIAFCHPHFAIHNLSSAFCPPQFSIRIQCYPPFVIRNFSFRIFPSAFSVIHILSSALFHPQLTVRIFRPHFDILIKRSSFLHPLIPTFPSAIRHLVCVLQRPFVFCCLHNDSMTNYRLLRYRQTDRQPLFKHDTN